MSYEKTFCRVKDGRDLEILCTVEEIDGGVYAARHDNGDELELTREEIKEIKDKWREDELTRRGEERFDEQQHYKNLP